MPQDLASQYAMAVGFVLPLVISCILQHHWSTQLKTAVAFVCVLLATAGTAYTQGKLDVHHVGFTLFYVFITAIGSFKGLWQPFGIADGIEKATTITKP